MYVDKKHIKNVNIKRIKVNNKGIPINDRKGITTKLENPVSELIILLINKDSNGDITNEVTNAIPHMNMFSLK